MWLDLKRWHFVIGCRFGGKALEWLERRALWIRRLEVCASPTSGFAQDKWGALASLVCACVTRGGLCGCAPPCHPAMSHLASSHLVQKSSLARPKRKADGPSPKDTSFWAPLMYIVGSQHPFESLCEQSSGFGYPRIPAQQAAVSSPKGGILRREDKVGTITPSKQHSSVHFFPKIMDSSSTLIPLSCSFSQEMPISFYQMPSAQDSGFTLSSGIPLTSKSTIVSCSHKDSSLGKQSPSFIAPRRQLQPSSDLDTYVLGDGEDYFLSLFGESKKLTARTSQTEDVSKHLSVILEEVGQFTSSSLGDIKIAEVNVKGFFVRLVNSSDEKEVEIGNHILQQNVNGHAVSLYRFPHNITLQASSTVTVWAAASEAKPQPPTDFVWDEQSRFRSSPDCTTILCNPNGEAIAWYTPIHWKQAWEKLETDIEFERCSVVIPSMRSHMFGWTTASTTSISKDKEEQIQKTPSQVCPVLVREKEIPPTVLPNKSPWCRNPNTSPHPYSSLIDSQDSDVSKNCLGTQLKPQSTKPKLDPGTKKKKSKS